jgi:hypothetical protein
MKTFFSLYQLEGVDTPVGVSTFILGEGVLSEF